ncbi:MAG TPA: response regulator transcription factor [Candidatus Obscuribacterales bacterium]
MAKVLVVEDDGELRGMVEDWLSHEHYEVECAATGTEGQEKLIFYNYDLIVLDWDLPGVSGLEICREMRNRGNKTPVLMLTGKGSISDKEVGLDSGADDYLTKPFHMKELSARIRALLRRVAGQTTNVLTARNLVLDPVKFAVTRDGQPINLRRREFALLEFFMRNPNRVFSLEALADRVWASESDASPEAIRSCLKRLRKSIGDSEDQPLIKTVHGVGYKLEC